MSTLFNPTHSVTDEEFRLFCTSTRFQGERAFLEALWRIYEPYADRDFPERISDSFQERFWEMYLACTLMYLNFVLAPKTKNDGPDIRLERDEGPVWVEAIAPRAGTGVDAVPGLEETATAFRVPEDKIVLRYTAAIYEKHKKYLTYVDKKIITPNAPYIIAVNGRNVPLSYDDELPYIIQAVLPVGPPSIHVKRDTGEVTWAGYKYRSTIEKSTGSSVSTRTFLDREYTGISGILFSRTSPFAIHTEMGTDFIFVHNPNAVNSLPKGWLNVGVEYWLEGDNLIKEQRGK